MPAVPLRWVLLRAPQEQCEPQALLSTKVEAPPQPSLAGFVSRWQMEVTCEEARAPRGMEPQRQWSEPAIARTPRGMLRQTERALLGPDCVCAALVVAAATFSDV
jgi:hypothetical protein